MRFSPISFLLGLGAACVLPIVSRAFRPFAVEATALGMTVFEDVQRIVAEQMENLEDLVAEARMRREEWVAAAELGGEDGSAHLESGAEAAAEEVAGSPAV
ncbi:MAG: hypothetical protein C5B48_05150 [Candidatus Rokuibacteriota bacterium]|nr:MAG: hypothetical protein C5B48_05150 [Candidatus Rokubacteria bacterium]